MRIALAGNPNSGKTTLFNAITGKTEKVGNWSGVTTTMKEAELKKKYNSSGQSIKIIDLPGTYSLAAYSEDQEIARNYILQEKPDVIINIVDGANLSRSLFFTTQLLELGIPVVVALNKMDILMRRGDKIDIEALGKTLNCRVVPITATSEAGLKELLAEAIKLGEKKEPQVAPFSFSGLPAEADRARQKFVDDVAQKCFVKKRDSGQITLSDKIDRIVAHKWLGIPIFILVMWAVFAISIEGIGGYFSDYINEVLFGEIIPDAANEFFEGLGVSPLLQGLIVDGAIAGVGAVLGFLPLIMVLFFCLSLLEDSGYMARVAVVMDRFFKKIGLSGKSIIPMIVGSGCGIPGVMATRTIEDVNEKRKTIILTPYIPCGAKLPIIALFTAVFFPDHSWVAPSMYIISIVMIVVGALLLKKVFLWEDTDSQFIMELPEYKLPSLKYAFWQMLDKAKAFIYRASTIILVCNTVVWFMQAFDWSLTPVEDQSLSILASVGSVISPLLIPLGFVGWQLAAAAITGFVAKENVVATFAVLLAAASEEALAVPGGPLTGLFTPVTAFAYMIFVLFTPPCFAAIGAMNAEMGVRKWLLKGVAFQFSFGYLAAMVVSQVGSLLVYGTPGVGFIPSIIVAIAALVYLVVRIKRLDAQRAIGVGAK